MSGRLGMDNVSMRFTPRQPSKQTPHNKSDRARAAELRGERTWTNWRLSDLVQEVGRLNTRGVTEFDLRQVRNLEYLKVKLLVPTEEHHTKLRMPAPLTLNKDQFFALDTKLAAKLTPETISKWRDRPPTPDELDEAVENLAGRRYYRRR